MLKPRCSPSCSLLMSSWPTSHDVFLAHAYRGRPYRDSNRIGYSLLPFVARMTRVSWCRSCSLASRGEGALRAIVTAHAFREHPRRQDQDSRLMSSFFRVALAPTASPRAARILFGLIASHTSAERTTSSRLEQRLSRFVLLCSSHSCSSSLHIEGTLCALVLPHLHQKYRVVKAQTALECLHSAL